MEGARRLLRSGRYRLRRQPGFRDADRERMWARKVMYAEVRERLLALPPSSASAIEISGDQWSTLPWATYRSTGYSDVDICDPPADFPGRAAYDVAICEQVLHCVRDPLAGVRHIRRMVRPGGLAVVSTPFLVRLDSPKREYWRFTEHGLRVLLETAGFDEVETGSWGNRRSVTGNLRRWAPHARWRSLRNEPDVPVVVWSFARR